MAKIISRDEILLYLTTAFLVEQMSKSRFLQVDCTYKLIWNDYPILIPATADYIVLFCMLLGSLWFLPMKMLVPTLTFSMH
jgi:hypothetical protein